MVNISKTSGGNTTKMKDSRKRLVSGLRSVIRDQRVLSSIAITPREMFVPNHLHHLSYEDRPLSIGERQTISQPLIVAIMLEALKFTGEESVLEIGTGTGYQTVLLSQLVRQVVSVERIPKLTEKARQIIKTLECINVTIEQAGNELGCKHYAPYDAIIVASGAPRIPDGLISQLRVGGRMIIPVGSRESQDLKSIIKEENGIRVKDLGACRFVPLIGVEGWPDSE